MGFATLRVEHNGNKHELNFVIVGQKVTPLLGLKSYQIRGLGKIMISGVDTTVNNVNIAPEPAVPGNVSSDPVLSPFEDIF